MPTEADFALMRNSYAELAPRPGEFESLAAHFGDGARGTGWSDEELASITSPTLVLVGDTDFVPLNAVAMFEALPNAELAVLPGTTHMGVIRHTGAGARHCAALPRSDRLRTLGQFTR